MGQHDLILIAMILAPVVLISVLRTNAPLVFLSACLGYTVGHLLGSDLQAFASLFLAPWGLAGASADMLLILVPSLLTMLFLTGSIKGSQRLLNIVPALAAGLLITFLVLPLLPAGAASQLLHTTTWQQLARVQAFAVGGGAVVCLLLLWLQRPGGRSIKPDKKHSSD